MIKLGGSGQVLSFVVQIFGRITKTAVIDEVERIVNYGEKRTLGKGGKLFEAERTQLFYTKASGHYEQNLQSKKMTIRASQNKLFISVLRGRCPRKWSQTTTTRLHRAEQLYPGFTHLMSKF